MSSHRDLKVGIPVSLSGQFQVQGMQALAGLQSWVDDVNQSGGLTIGQQPSGWTLSLVSYDDGSQAEQVRKVTSRLIAHDQVDLLFGPYSSVLARAAAEVAEGHQRLMWNQGGASDDIYEQGFKWLVGVLTPASGYLSGLLPLVRQADPEANTVGIIRAQPGAFPKQVTSAVQEQAASLGFGITHVLEYPAALTDFSGVLEEIKEARPQVLVAVGRISNDIRFAQQLASSAVSPKLVAVVAAPIQQFSDALGLSVEKFVGPSQWEPEVGYPNDYGPTASEVLKSLSGHGQVRVDYPAAQAYAAGLVAQACVEMAGSLDDAALRHAASALDVSTFYGRFKIEAETGRQIGRSTLIVQWQEGKKLVIWPPEQARANLNYPWRD